MVDKFLKYIQYEKKYSYHTILSYENDLKQFISYCNDFTDVKNVVDVKTIHVRQWIVYLMESGDIATSVRRKISCLKSFFKFLQREGFIKKNPAQFVLLPKKPKPIPKFFRESEINQVLSLDINSKNERGGYKENIESSKNSFVFCRDKLIIDFFYQTGVRVSELVNIKDIDLSFSGKYLKVFGKRNKERMIPVGQDLIQSVTIYKQLREKIVVLKSGYLFVRSNGSQMYSRGVYNIVHRQMSLVSSVSKRSPHVLRHTFASVLLNNGADINAIKGLLGHSSLAATEIYTHVSFKHLQFIYKHAHPRAQKLGGLSYEH